MQQPEDPGMAVESRVQQWMLRVI